MRAAATLTPERLRELFSYDAMTGLFTRLVGRQGGGVAGAVVESVDSRGNIRICIDYAHYSGNRLAWFLMTGEWPPEGTIVVRQDERLGDAWANLQLAPAGNGGRQQSRRVRHVCGHCGKPRLIAPSRATRRYCSVTCGVEANRGPANSNWLGGRTSARAAFFTSPEWKAASLAVWRRDQATCQLCSDAAKEGDKPFHVHHIRGWAKHEELRLEESNLVLLCSICHPFVHSKRNVERRFL